MKLIRNTIIFFIATFPIWFILLLICANLSTDGSLTSGLIKLIKACLDPRKALLLVLFLAAAMGLWIKKD